MLGALTVFTDAEQLCKFIDVVKFGSPILDVVPDFQNAPHTLLERSIRPTDSKPASLVNPLLLGANHKILSYSCNV